MIRRTLVVLGVLCIALVASACFGGGSDDSSDFVLDSPIIDPAVIEKIEEAGEARVLVALRALDDPLAPLEIAKAHTAEVQNRVLAILEPGHFELQRQFAISPAFSGIATAAAIDELSKHPDVVAIELLVDGGELH